MFQHVCYRTTLLEKTCSWRTEKGVCVTDLSSNVCVIWMRVLQAKKTRMWFWLTKNNKCSIMLSAWLLFVLCVMLGPVRGRVCHACVTEVSRVRHGSVTRVSRKDFRGPKTHKHAVWTQSTYNSSKSANESRKHVLCIFFSFLSIQNHIHLFYSDSRLSESHTTFWTSNVS